MWSTEGLIDDSPFSEWSDMEEIKAMLIKEKEALLSELTKAKETVIEHEIGDEIDSSVEDRDREMSLKLQDREREKLARIEDALQRIEAMLKLLEGFIINPSFIVPFKYWPMCSNAFSCERRGL